LFLTPNNARIDCDISSIRLASTGAIKIVSSPASVPKIPADSPAILGDLTFAETNDFFSHFLIYRLAPVFYLLFIFISGTGLEAH